MAEIPSKFKPYVVDIGGLSNSQDVSWKGVPVLIWWGEGFVTLKGWAKIGEQHATKAGEQISWTEHIIETGQTRTFSNVAGQDMSIYLLETAPTPPPPSYTCPHCGATFGSQGDLDTHIASEHPDEPPPSPPAGISGIHLMYCVSPAADFNRVRSAEVNLIHNYGHMGRGYLDKAQAAGLYVLYDLKPLIHDRLRGKSDAEQWSIWNGSKNEVRSWINEAKDHPATYGYYVLDEPNLYGGRVPLDLQRDIRNFVKSVDPNHIVAMVVAGGPGEGGYASADIAGYDLLIADTYCYGAAGLPDLRWACSHLRAYLDEHGINVPVVFTVQACGDVSVAGGKPHDNWYGHVRDQIDIVLNHNLATGGIGMWAWWDDIGDGAGQTDRNLNEVRDAWGASTWGPPPTPVYTCPYCGATFSSQAELDAHIATVHPPVPEYTCPYCGATFSTQAELDAHVASQHPIPVFTCPHCGATFATQTELDNHIVSEHPIAAEVPWYKKYAPYLAVGGTIAGGMAVGATIARRKK